jgi:hypothetical protein
MDEFNEKKHSFKMEDSIGRLIVKGEIIGESELEFYDDLKLKAVIALINSVDQQNFEMAGKMDVFNYYVREIEETLSEVKKHSRFRQNT